MSAEEKGSVSLKEDVMVMIVLKDVGNGKET